MTRYLLPINTDRKASHEMRAIWEQKLVASTRQPAVISCLSAHDKNPYLGKTDRKGRNSQLPAWSGVRGDKVTRPVVHCRVPYRDLFIYFPLYKTFLQAGCIWTVISRFRCRVREASTVIIFTSVSNDFVQQSALCIFLYCCIKWKIKKSLTTAVEGRSSYELMELIWNMVDTYHCNNVS